MLSHTSRLREIPIRFCKSWNVELPESTPVRNSECRSQVVEIAATGDFFRSEAHHMRRGLLAIDEAKSPRLQLAHQRDQGDFRGIGYTGEHRLCEEGAAQRYAIEPTNQLSFLPGFNGMGVPEFV